MNTPRARAIHSLTVTSSFCAPAPRASRWRPLALGLLLALGGALTTAASRAEDHAAADHGAKPAPPKTETKPAGQAPAKASAASETAPAPEKIDLGNDIKKALREQMLDRKKLTVVVSDKPEVVATTLAPAAAPAAQAVKPAASVRPATVPAVVKRPSAPVRPAAVNPRASREYIQARAAALAGHSPAPGEPGAEPAHASAHAHWSYSGATGPQAWGQLQPEFKTCAMGKRQAPINIEDVNTLQGPAEPLQFNYLPSQGVVVNNGHTIQVRVEGINTLTVRGDTYNLLQFHFHTPSEEMINNRNFAMVAHLVHQNASGQLAVLAVLLEPGEANTLIDRVWTHMPLDINDEVRLPSGLLNLNELLPADQRYYQFMGSLTTPPCTEGVLWMVFKEPVSVSRAQWRLFQQLYPQNARPVQALNGRPVRSAQ